LMHCRELLHIGSISVASPPTPGSKPSRTMLSHWSLDFALWGGKQIMGSVVIGKGMHQWGVCH